MVRETISIKEASVDDRHSIAMLSILNALVKARAGKYLVTVREMRSIIDVDLFAIDDCLRKLQAEGIIKPLDPKKAETGNCEYVLEPGTHVDISAEKNRAL